MGYALLYSGGCSVENEGLARSRPANCLIMSLMSVPKNQVEDEFHANHNSQNNKHGVGNGGSKGLVHGFAAGNAANYLCHA